MDHVSGSAYAAPFAENYMCASSFVYFDLATVDGQFRRRLVFSLRKDIPEVLVRFLRGFLDLRARDAFSYRSALVYHAGPDFFQFGSLRRMGLRPGPEHAVPKQGMSGSLRAPGKLCLLARNHYEFSPELLVTTGDAWYARSDVAEVAELVSPVSVLAEVQDALSRAFSTHDPGSQLYVCDCGEGEDGPERTFAPRDVVLEATQRRREAEEARRASWLEQFRALCRVSPPLHPGRRVAMRGA